jgi:outer membrane protein TolC
MSLLQSKYPFLTAMLAAAVLSFPAFADPQSDLFQPDVLRTGAALQHRTAGLTDPLGRDCALPAGALSIAAAVDLALCRNPSTRSAWASAREQAAALGQAESAWLPTVGATASETRDYGEHVDATGNLDSSPQNVRDAALNLSWTLYDFGGRGGRIRSANRLLDAAAKTAHGALAVVLDLNADHPLKLDAQSVPAEVPALTLRMADLMAEAMRQRPDLAAARAQRDAAEANITVARAVGRPSISIQAGRNLAYTAGVANQNYNQVGVYVTVPIFNGFNTSYGVRQAQAVLEASEANVEQARLNVTLGVWNAYYSLDSANQQLAGTATLVKTAEDNNQVAIGRYQSGVGTIIDVLTAQTAAAGARLLRIDAEFGWEVARAQLALALGRLTGADPLDPRPDLP